MRCEPRVTVQIHPGLPCRSALRSNKRPRETRMNNLLRNYS
jgi:hypothetical protein